jgi:hypothetical protein
MVEPAATAPERHRELTSAWRPLVEGATRTRFTSLLRWPESNRTTRAAASTGEPSGETVTQRPSTERGPAPQTIHMSPSLTIVRWVEFQAGRWAHPPRRAVGEVVGAVIR